jgi:hypothetical protein
LAEPLNDYLAESLDNCLAEPLDDCLAKNINVGLPFNPEAGSPRRRPNIPVVVRVHNHLNVKLKRSSEDAYRLAVYNAY